MKKVSRSRSGYLIKPVAKGVKSPEKTRTQLASPFPPHVHKFLFSGREITLCDQSGIRISKVTDLCENTKRHVDTVLAKLNRRRVQDHLDHKRTSILPVVDDPNQPYHLNERICGVLKEFADRQSERGEWEDPGSDDSSLEFVAPPQPSPLLRRFLREDQRNEKTLQQRRKKRQASLPIEHFSLPRRGSHPGIVGSHSPSASTVQLPSVVSSPAARSSAPSPKDVTVWKTARKHVVPRSNNVSPRVCRLTKRETSRRKKRLTSLYEVRK